MSLAALNAYTFGPASRIPQMHRQSRISIPGRRLSLAGVSLT